MSVMSNTLMSWRASWQSSCEFFSHQPEKEMPDQLFPFVNDLPAQLLCPSCKGLFQRPVIIGCGHTVCEGCIRLLSNCPVDQEVIRSKSEYVKNKVIESQISELRVRCSHGVKWTDSKSYQIDPSGCPEQVELGKIGEHEAACVFRQVGCRFCDCHTIRYKDLASHIQTCKRRAKVNGIKRHSSNIDAFIPDSTTPPNNACCSCGLELMKLHKENRELKGMVEKLCERVNSLETFQRESMEKILRVVSSQGEVRSRNDSRETAVNPRSSFSQSVIRPRPLSWSLRKQERRTENWTMPFTFKCIGVMRGHQSAIRCMVVQDTYIVTASEDGTIKVWDVTLLIRGQFGNHIGKGSIATVKAYEADPISWLCVSPDFSVVVTGSANSCLKKWSLDKMTAFSLVKTSERGEQLQSEMTCGVVSSRLIFTGTYKAIHIWSTESLSKIRELGEIHHWVRALALSQDEKLLAGGAHGQIHLWATDSLQLLHTIQHDNGSVYALALTASKIIYGTYNRCVHVLDLETRQPLNSLLGQLDTNKHVLVTSSEKYLLVASNDGSVQVWDLENGLLIQELKRHENGAYVVGIASDLIFSAGQDAEIKVYKYFKMENMR